MRASIILRAALLGVFLASYVPWAYAAETTAPEKEPDPMVVLKQACDYLKSLKQFSFRSEVIDEQVYYKGRKLQYGIDMETTVERPDKLRVNAVGDLVNRQFYYNGNTITLYDKNAGIYAAMEVPPGIEEALDKAQKEFGLRVALTDLASPALWELVSKDIENPIYVGLHKVHGVPCHHLAFEKRGVQVQVWIDAGTNPLPLKIVFNRRKQEGSPEWTAYLSAWDTTAHPADDLFTFVPPPGVEKVKFVEAPKPSIRGERGGKS